MSRGCTVKKASYKKRLKKDKKRLDKRAKIVYNKRCRKSLQTATCDEYTEKYSRGRRGAPAKGVGRLSRRESSNLSFSANKNRTFVGRQMFCFCLSKPQAWHIIRRKSVYHQGRVAPLYLITRQRASFLRLDVRSEATE